MNQSVVELVSVYVVSLEVAVPETLSMTLSEALLRLQPGPEPSTPWGGLDECRVGIWREHLTRRTLGPLMSPVSRPLGQTNVLLPSAKKSGVFKSEAANGMGLQ